MGREEAPTEMIDDDEGVSRRLRQGTEVDRGMVKKIVFEAHQVMLDYWDGLRNHPAGAAEIGGAALAGGFVAGAATLSLIHAHRR